MNRRYDSETFSPVVRSNRWMNSINMFLVLFFYLLLLNNNSFVEAAFFPADHVFIQQGNKIGNSFEGHSGSGVAITADGKTLLVSNLIGDIVGETQVGMLVDTRANITDIFVLDNFILAKFDPNENNDPTGSFQTKIAASDDGSTVAIISMNFTHERVSILSGTSWAKNQTFPIDTSTATTRMIPSVAVSGDGQTVVFGSGSIPDTPVQPTCVHVFQLSDEDEWIASQLSLDDVETETEFQSRRCQVGISADGSTILVGLPWIEQGSGGAFVYLRNGIDNTYSQAMRLVQLDTATGVGDQLAINREGNLAIVFSQTANSRRGAFWAFQQHPSVPGLWFPLAGMNIIQDPELPPIFSGSGIYGPLILTMGADETIAI